MSTPYSPPCNQKGPGTRRGRPWPNTSQEPGADEEPVNLRRWPWAPYLVVYLQRKGASPMPPTLEAEGREPSGPLQ